jgi:hypothetical protein
MSFQPACRLHLVFASQAHVALIVRRGPTRWFHIIRWDYDRNNFDHGSWFYGRIYEQSCRISPDGRWFVYFAANHSQRTRRQLGVNSWYAVGRLPWLKALWISPEGSTYHVRQRFVAPGTPEYEHGLVVDALRNRYRLAHDTPFVPEELVPDADWSGHDLRGRVIYCQGGRIFRQAAKGDDQLIADFSDLRPPARGRQLDGDRDGQP